MRECQECGADLDFQPGPFCWNCGSPTEPPQPQPTGGTPAPAAGQNTQPEPSAQPPLTGGEDLKQPPPRLDPDCLDAESSGSRPAVKSDGTQGDSWHPDSSPIALEINDNRFYMENRLGILDFRICNLTSRAVTDIRLEVTGGYLGSEEHDYPLLAAGQSHREKIQVVPRGSGEHLINVRLTCEVDGRRWACRAQPELKVLDEHVAPENLKLIVDNSIRAGEGAKLGFGMSVKNEVDEGFAKGLIRTVNDLLTQDFPERWKSIQWTRQEAHAGVDRLTVDPRLATRRYATDRASLVSAEPGCAQRVLLLGLVQVRLGRRRGINDIVLRLFPRSSEADARCQQITASKPHLVVTLSYEGLSVADQGTTNGTELNGVQIRGQGDVAVPLDRASEINVARALKLRLVPFIDTENADEQAARCRELGEPDDLWRMAAKLGLRSLLIERVDNLAAEEKYLIVYRWAGFGHTADNEVLLSGMGKQVAPMRILRLGGQFWVENTSAAGNVVVEGVGIDPGRCCSLTPGMTVECGQTTWSFCGFGQTGLE